MQSVVSIRGQTVIPKEIREKLGIKQGTKLRWEVRDGKAAVRILPEDPIRSMRGALKGLGFTTEDVLAERRADREKEEADVEEMLRRWRRSS